MTEVKSTVESQASTNTQRILTENLYAFLTTSMIPMILGRFIELFTVYSSLMFEQRNISGFTRDDIIFFFLLYQLFAMYLPVAFQAPLLIKYSSAHVNGDLEMGRAVVRNYLLAIIICTVLLIAIGYPIVLVFEEQLNVSERILPACYYFIFFEFPLSSISTSYTAKYLAEGRKLLYFGSKAAVFGIWAFLEGFISQFFTVAGTAGNNLISVVCCAIGHVVVAIWLGFWNNKRDFLNAINLSEDAITLKEVFERQGEWKRTKDILMGMAEGFLIFFSYCSSAIVLMLILKTTEGFHERDTITTQLQNYYVYCDVLRISTTAHLQMLSLVYSVTMTRQQYKRASESIMRLHFISGVFCALLFLLIYFAKMQQIFTSGDAAFTTFMQSAAYQKITLEAFIIILLSVVAETSQVFILHSSSVFTFAAIVAAKLVTGIIAMNKMVYYYGEDCEIMLVILFSEGISIVGHAINVIVEAVLLQLRIRKAKAQSGSPRKSRKA